MKEGTSQREINGYWMEKAVEALQSARSEQTAGRLTFAMNRAYYACFYSASAVLMNRGKSFKKHTGVRSGVRNALANEGLMDSSWSRFYNRIFESRQRADYLGFVHFSPEEVEDAIVGAEKFVAIMTGLLNQSSCPPSSDPP